MSHEKTPETVRVDCDKTFCSSCPIFNMRLKVAIVATQNLELHEKAAKTASLNADLNEDIYTKQSKACVDRAKPEHMSKLMKAFFGLEHAPLQ